MSLSPTLRQSKAAPALALIERRRRPARRLLGMLAVALRHDDFRLIEVVLTEAMGWPEANELEQLQKARLLFAITSLLARADYMELALRIAPMIPAARGMAQVLVLSTDHPQERFCWRVTPAYALVQWRKPDYIPTDILIQPYQRGQVTIDQAYLKRVLLPRRREPRPILLMPHPLGMIELDGAPHLILDGNHRVVCAWCQERPMVPAYVLTPEEAAAVLHSHSQWPPYPRSMIDDSR